MPYAPGTAGTLVAIPIFIALQDLPVPVYAGIMGAMLLAGMWICARASIALGVHDHSGIVWDEVVGYLFAMLAAPSGWSWILTGALLFRAFDIIKPWPASLVDRRVGGGAGIMLDDIVAGLYSLLVIQAVAAVA
jgi:phosphatidylglycerophosphatase A